MLVKRINQIPKPIRIILLGTVSGVTAWLVHSILVSQNDGSGKPVLIGILVSGSIIISSTVHLGILWLAAYLLKTENEHKYKAYNAAINWNALVLLTISLVIIFEDNGGTSHTMNGLAILFLPYYTIPLLVFVGVKYLRSEGTTYYR